MTEKMKPSGIAWIGDIPAEWSIKKIKYLSVLKGRIGWQGLTSDEYTDEGALLITGTDFDNGRINWDTCVHVPMKRWEQAKDIQIKNGDLLITKDDTVGKVAIVDGLDSPASLNSGVLRISTYDGYDKQFLFWVLQSDVFWTWFSNKNAGNSTIIHLYQNDFAEFDYPIPPLPEQCAIATFINDKCSQIDSIIADMEQQVEILQQYKKALITETVTKGLDKSVPMKDSGISWIGEVPEHWEISKIKYCSRKIGSGKTPLGGAEIYEEDGVIFIRSQNVYDEGLRLDDVAYISAVVDREMTNTRVLPNDVLINITGASIGRCCIYDRTDNANVNQHVCIIRTNGYILSPEFLRYVINSYIGQTQIAVCQMGGNRESLTFQQIGMFTIPIPPIEEQLRLVEVLNSKCEIINGTVSEKQRSIETMRQYKESLIYEYVTGKKRVAQ